jgi:hypothetical protein
MSEYQISLIGVIKKVKKPSNSFKIQFAKEY